MSQNDETGLSTQETNVEGDETNTEITPADGNVSKTVENATTVTLQRDAKIVIALLKLDSLRQEKQDTEE